MRQHQAVQNKLHLKSKKPKSDENDPLKAANKARVKADAVCIELQERKESWEGPAVKAPLGEAHTGQKRNLPGRAPVGGPWSSVTGAWRKGLGPFGVEEREQGKVR